MMTFLLLVTWLAYGQPPSDYQVPFSSNEACEAARLQLIKDAERIGQSMIERASAQDRQIGGNNKTALLMAAISNAPYVSAVCVQTSVSKRECGKKLGPCRGSGGGDGYRRRSKRVCWQNGNGPLAKHPQDAAETNHHEKNRQCNCSCKHCDY